ncbi:MAG: adenine phosphoribosyltransferase [Deltaproteobacteria bacterium]|nr:adenine phosphoribosyltransferase [Deltaproteobacteria bacterium]MBW2694649.1 adenine phosphoribosyltransferase [Deltaproteobacteria bacterium]
MDIKGLIRTIPDHPKPGIQFRDITTLLLDPAGIRSAVTQLAEPFSGDQIQKVAGVEARGFIFGLAVALQLDVGFVPIRKPGKLPWETVGEDYELEYGTDRVEVHRDAIQAGERVLLVDDLIATGGTAAAAIRVIERVGGTVEACAFVIELPDLGGRSRVEGNGRRILSICSFEGE